MRSCLFFLGVSLSAFSCAYGMNVGPELTSYPSISDAIGRAKTSTPTLNLTQSVQLESGITIPISLTKVTINGTKGGTKVAPPSVTGTYSFLFNDSTSITLELDFNNLTFQGFPADYGAVIRSTNSNDMTIGGISSGPVTFVGNRVNNMGGVIYSSNGNVIFSGDDSVTFRENQSADSGGAIAVSSSKNVTLNGTGVVNFSGNKAKNNGGAIHTGSGQINLSGAGHVTFNSNSSQNGGAINAGGALSISGNVPAVFTNNTALVNGGAINAAGAVTLTNTQFMGNTAEMGGAVYMSTANPLTYQVDSSVVMNPSTGASQGDNDIAGVSGTTFKKTGNGDLIINTMNPGWLGTTQINAGRFIVGENLENTGATWGGSTTRAGAITVNGAILGGYGTIYASGVTFTTGSTWLLGLNPNMRTVGLLNLTGALALPQSINAASGMTIEIDGLRATSIPDAGYTVARFGSLMGDLAGLNKLLTSSNLILQYPTGSTTSLVLKQIKLQSVGLGGSTFYPTIKTALASPLSTQQPTLYLNQYVQQESEASDLSGFSSLSVTSFSAGGTTVQLAPGITPPFTLFTTSSDLTLTNLTLQGFGLYKPELWIKF